MRNITVTDISISANRPNVKNFAAAKLLPKNKNINPEKVRFVLDNTNSAISNGLMRTICDGLPVIAMSITIGDIKTSDPHILEEMIVPRIRSIPILQSTPRNSKFVLDVVNDSDEIRDVKSSEISTGKLSLPFNETFTICTLAPHCYLRIDNIVIREEYGYVKKNGMHAVAYATAGLTLDVKPFDMEGFYAKDRDPNAKDSDFGTPSREANPHKFAIIFNTNGTMPGKDIVRVACDELIKRIQFVLDSVDNITIGSLGSILTIPDETDTIGNLYMKTITELYPGVDYVKYEVSGFERSVDIVVRFPDFDIKTMFVEVSEYLIGVYKTIRSHFAK